MKTKILVAALVCLSVVAVAQQSGSGQPSKPSQDTAAREAATGKATGKTTAHDDWQAQTAVGAGGGPHVKAVSATDAKGNEATAIRESPSKGSTNLRESPSKQSLGKTSAVDAPADRESPSKGSLVRESPTRQQVVQVSAGDVNGDGKAKQSSQSDVKSPRDISTGQASGKRQHQPLLVKKEVDASTPK
jgi:hypothetical protein